MRITNKDLETLVTKINKLTNSPMKYATKTETGIKCNPGHYHLDRAYGGIKLVRTCNEGGGIEEISRYGYGTKRELYQWMHAFIGGLEIQI
jgi:hypothetical protein